MTPIGRGKTLDDVHNFIQRTFVVECNDVNLPELIRRAADRCVIDGELVLDESGGYRLGKKALERLENTNNNDDDSMVASGGAQETV
jgi:hypothetical protein